MLRRREATGTHTREDAQEGMYLCLDYPPADLMWDVPQVWINQGDIVLLSLRDFQDDKADVIVKYTADEARNCMCGDRRQFFYQLI